MRRFANAAAALTAVVFLVSACATSDPNVEGAKLDLRNKDYDAAMTNIETALERNPNNAEAHVLRGEVIVAQAGELPNGPERIQRYRDAADSYRRALSLSEGNEAINARATIGLRQAYYDAFKYGADAFNRGRNDDAAYGEAASAFEAATYILPDSADAYVNLGYALINADRPNDAIQPLRTAVDKGGADAATYVLLGDLYVRNNNSAEAVTLLRAAQGRFPDNDEIRSGLLNAYVSSGQSDQALEEYRQAVEGDPSNKLFRYNYGSLLLQSDRYDEAIEQLQAAAQLDPTYGSAFYNLGAAYVNKAVELNEQISQMDDDLRANRSSLSQSEISSREAEMDRLAEQRREFFQQAIEPLETAQRLYQGTGEDVTGVCQALYQAYVQTNQLEKAEATAECAGYGK